MKQKLLKLAFLAAAVLIFMMLVVIFAATALYLFLATHIGGINAALVIAGIALAFLGGVLWFVLRLVARMRFGLGSLLGASAMGAVGPTVIRSAASRFAGATPIGSIAAMGFSYWMARRKNRNTPS